MNNGVNNKNDLGSNVKIAPAQNMYDENGKIIEQPKIEPKKEEVKVEEVPKPVVNQPVQPVQQPVIEPKQKKKLNLTPLLFIIVLFLIGYIFYQNQDFKQQIKQIQYRNIVINTNGKEVELDNESTLIKTLYSKVKTNIREDYANNKFDNEMKLYLAFRQINNSEFYESKCAFFSPNYIYNHKCDELKFTPLGFKGETLQREIKTLFGENTNIENANIQLGRSCMGGYEYIKSKDEYVQGECTVKTAIDITKTSNIVKASRIDNNIYIIEEIKYTSKGEIPAYLKNGYMIHTFELDSNQNYVYVNKEYKTKY